LIKNFSFLLVVLLFVLSACTSTPEPTLSLAPTIKPTLIPTATSLPSPTPLIEFSAEYFSFPVSFYGDYQIDKPLRYVPYYHWDGITKGLIEDESWWNLFHAGDMYVLNLKQPRLDIVVISPTDGIIERVTQYNEENIEINIETSYYLDGRRVYVDITHSQRLFPGDDKYPEIHQGDIVEMGQPIAIQSIFLKHGRNEQVLDIAIRNGPRGANPSIAGNYFPESYIDPFLFLKDDILEYGKYVTYDDISYRDHCSESIHFPYSFLPVSEE